MMYYYPAVFVLSLVTHALVLRAKRIGRGVKGVIEGLCSQPRRHHIWSWDVHHWDYLGNKAAFH